MKGITIHKDGDGRVREVRYVTDDRDARDGRRLELCIGWGNNGDWYIVTVPEGERSVSAVRLCTSGGASSAVPGFVPLIAEAFRKLVLAGDPAAPAEPLQPEGEQEKWTSDGCGLFCNGARVTSTAVPEVAASLAHKLNERVPPPAAPVVAASESIRAAAEELALQYARPSVMGTGDDGWNKAVDRITAIITRYFAAAPAPSETAVGGEVRRCVECSHDVGVDKNGVCNGYVTASGSNFLPCLCKCEFAAPLPAAGDDEGERTLATAADEAHVCWVDPDCDKQVKMVFETPAEASAFVEAFAALRSGKGETNA